MALTKITTGLIAANTLATANIADNSVDATKIASNSILTRHIDDDQVTGDQLADNITIAGNLTITGDLTTNGSTVTNSSTNTTIEDAIIELGTGTSGAPATDAGIVIERGSSDNVFIGWDESADKVIVGTGSFTGASTGNLTITAAPLVSGALTASGLTFPTSDGSSGQVISTDGSGTLSFADNTTKVDNYTATGNGSTTAFDTGTNPGNEVNTWIFVDGVYQQKSQYSYSGSTVTFSTAPENGALIDVITGTSSNITASDTVLGVYEATTTNTDAYSTGISAANENNTWVFVGGVYQPKDSYTFSSGTLTFDANTPTGQKLSVVATKTLTAGTVDTASLAANATTSAKIASNAILSRHIVNNSIVGADISATTQITANTFTGALTGNVTGNVAGNLTGTILTAAQTNITSVGTLSAATVSGQLTAGGLAYPTSDGNADQVLKTDGSGTISFGTVSGTTLNNNTNNYVMTGTGSANTLNGESSLQFDGTNLTLADGDFLYTGGGNFDIKHNTASANIVFSTTPSGGSATARMRITHDGNVGIGTDSPIRVLQVGTHGTGNGEIALGSATNGVGSILFGDGASGADIYRGYVQYNHTADALLLATAAAERMRITSAGKVHIGNTFTADGSYDNLVVGTGAGNEGMTIYGAANGASSIAFADPNDNDVGNIMYDHSSNFMKFVTNAGERMRIDSSGRVGINRTPSVSSTKLEIGGADDTQLLLLEASGYTGGLGIGATGLQFFTQSTVRGKFDSTGEFLVNRANGFGTGGAAAMFVTGRSDAGIYVTGPNTSGYALMSFLNGGLNGIGSIKNLNNNALTFYSNSDYRLKENVDYTWDATTRLKQLKPARFNWISDDSNTTVDGFLAHEVSSIVPDAVDGVKDGTKTSTNCVLNSEGNLQTAGITEEEWVAGKAETPPTFESNTSWTASHTQDVYQAIDESKLIPLLVKTIQELEARITTLEG